jgi:hypothetical protein
MEVRLMKKAILLMLTFVLAISLVACGGNSDNGGGSTTTPPSNSNSTTPPSNSSEASEKPADSTPSQESGETGLNESIKKWPDNEWTQQLPKPITGVLISASLLADNGGFNASLKQMTDDNSITFSLTEDDYVAYTESLIAAGWSRLEQG